MLPRYLLPLALLICLVAAPAALANNGGDQPGNEQPACVPAGDADADNVSQEDVCQGNEGTPPPQSCEPAPEPAGEQPTGEEAAQEEADAGDDETADAGDELDLPGDPLLPFESGREYRDFCEAPEFDQGFLRRTWRFGGEASGFGDGVLTTVIGTAPRVPARFREQAERLVGLEVAVVVGRRTDLVAARRARGARRGARRGSSRRVSRRTLRRAGRVQIQGKLLPPSRWRQDANGQRIPTIRASRITLSS